MRITTTPILILSLLAQMTAAQNGPIDRQALVSRHNVVVRLAEPFGPLAVGNGEFAFNADVTGLETFPEFYEKTMPIGILSGWGWHSFPNPKGYSIDKYKLTCYATRKGRICYPRIVTDNREKVSDSMLSEEALYIRANPHRFGLGRIGLEMTKADGSKVALTDLRNIEQKLDLWSGLLASSFEVEGVPVKVETAVHPRRDEVAVRVDSPLIASGRLKVRIGFPYASGSWGLDYENWNRPEAHQTTLARRGRNGADFHRRLDATQYDVRAAWSPGFALTGTGPHAYLLTGAGQKGPLELAVWFSPKAIDGEPDRVAAVESACREHWKRYWMSGGAIDFSGTEDPRARELERRIVLSQYVEAVHSAGSLPPQETGLVADSWHGKFHMEMYWWHSAHFALWGRPELLERSMGALTVMLPKARETARQQGYRGARWPKMVGPDGSDCPSWVGPMMAWQQPHPIHLAELIYRAHPDRPTLERYKETVFETANFMASFLDWDEQRKQFVLGPGIASADESHLELEKNVNPTMELGYWRWALAAAQQWRVRLGLGADPQWAHVLKNMAPLPVRDGVYPVLESIPEKGASRMATWLYGILPGKDVDLEVMRNTLHQVARERTAKPETQVTWGVPMMAMCAARLGEPELAVDLMVNKYEGRNPFLPSGYAYRAPTTPAYFPATGGWLTAAAMMAAGWDGAPHTPAPGFPKNWKVRAEGFHPMP